MDGTTANHLCITNDNPANCPRCGDAHVVHNGHSKGRQRILCHACKHTFFESFTEDKHKQNMRPRYDAFRAIAHIPYTLRRLAEIIGISVGTAFKWRHEYKAELCKQPTLLRCFDTGDGALQLTTVYFGKEPSHYPMSDRKRNSPQLACFSAITACQNDVLSTILHPACFTSPSPTLVAPGRMTRDALSNLLVQMSYPGACISTPLGLGSVLHDDTQRTKSTRVFWHQQKPKVAAGTDWRTACSQIRTINHRYEYEAIEARHLFRSFIRRLRGIAVNNLDKYVSWYNVCQALA
jgi:transposase-like protein